jgi:beta-galactosidase/beta-glucuronidase
MTRLNWLNLNGEWDYLGGATAPSATNAFAKAPKFPLHPERIKVPFPPESYLSGIMRKQEINMWYRRTFQVPPRWKGQRVLLHFGAVDSYASVFLNGQLVGRHQGAWDAFQIDITDSLRRGNNELIVGAYDANDGRQSCGKDCVDRGDYTFSSGIWQTVWLEPVPDTHIKEIIIRPDLEESTVRLSSRTSGGAGRVRAEILVAGKSISVAEAGANTEFQISIPNVRVWSPEDPFLYDLKIQLLSREGKLLDEVNSYFGMRSITLGIVDGHLRPLLNGKFVFQLGPLDQGYWPDGLRTAPTDAALKFDLEVTKRVGFNLVRKHGKVEPQRWFYWADKMGLLVWQDMPAMWYPEETPERTRNQFEREWKTLIHQHQNSPAVIAWVPFNENWGAYDVKRITEWTRQLDPSRLVSGNSGYNNAPDYRPPPGDPGNGDFDDLHIYVGPGDPPRPSATRAAALGEYGGVGLLVPVHMWPVKNDAYEMQPSVDALTSRYERLQKELRPLVKDKGLGVAIYTQTTDVEHEVNGLLTYDREVEKMDFRRVKAANEGVTR